MSIWYSRKIKGNAGGVENKKPHIVYNSMCITKHSVQKIYAHCMSWATCFCVWTGMKTFLHSMLSHPYTVHSAVFYIFLWDKRALFPTPCSMPVDTLQHCCRAFFWEERYWKPEYPWEKIPFWRFFSSWLEISPSHAQIHRRGSFQFFGQEKAVEKIGPTPPECPRPRLISLLLMISSFYSSARVFVCSAYQRWSHVWIFVTFWRFILKWNNGARQESQRASSLLEQIGWLDYGVPFSLRHSGPLLWTRWPTFSCVFLHSLSQEVLTGPRSVPLFYAVIRRIFFSIHTHTLPDKSPCGLKSLPPGVFSVVKHDANVKDGTWICVGVDGGVNRLLFDGMRSRRQR